MATTACITATDNMHQDLVAVDAPSNYLSWTGSLWSSKALVAGRSPVSCGSVKRRRPTVYVRLDAVYVRLEGWGVAPRGRGGSGVLLASGVLERWQRRLIVRVADRQAVHRRLLRRVDGVDGRCRSWSTLFNVFRTAIAVCRLWTHQCTARLPTHANQRLPTIP